MNRSNQLLVLVALVFAANGVLLGPAAANDETFAVGAGATDPIHCVSPELQARYGPSVELVTRSETVPADLLWALLQSDATPHADAYEFTLRTARSFQHAADHAPDGVRPALEHWVSGSSYRPLRPDESRRVQQILTAYAALLDCTPPQQEASVASGPTDLQRLRGALDRLGVLGEGDDVDGVFDRRALEDALRLLRGIRDGAEERTYADDLEIKIEGQLHRLKRTPRSVPAPMRASNIVQSPRAPSTQASTRPAPVAWAPASPRPAPNESCTPGYDPCIPVGADVDCAGGRGNGPRYVRGPVRVSGSDPYGLDRDGDGYGCEH